MDVLAPVRTVHEAAAVCDHLAIVDDVERVVGLGLAPDGDPDAARDAGEALNVLAVRLPTLDVTEEQRTGDAATVVPARADDHDVDEVVVAEGFDGLADLRAALDPPLTVVEDPAG